MNGTAPASDKLLRGLPRGDAASGDAASGTAAVSCRSGAALGAGAAPGATKKCSWFSHSVCDFLLAARLPPRVRANTGPSAWMTQAGGTTDIAPTGGGVSSVQFPCTPDRPECKEVRVAMSQQRLTCVRQALLQGCGRQAVCTRDYVMPDVPALVTGAPARRPYMGVRQCDGI